MAHKKAFSAGLDNAATEIQRFARGMMARWAWVSTHVLFLSFPYMHSEPDW